MYFLTVRTSIYASEDVTLQIEGRSILKLLHYARRLGLSAWVVKHENGRLAATYHLDGGRLVKWSDYA